MSGNGRRLLLLNLFLILLLIVTPIAYYLVLPPVVPSHWGPEGEVTSYSSKLSMTLMLAFLMPLGNIIIVLVVLYRWTLLNKYPYLINISAIAVLAAMKDVDPVKRSEVVNRVFEATLAVGVVLGLYMWGLEVLILESMTGRGYIDFLLVYSIAGSILLLAAAILVYKRIYWREIQLLTSQA